MKYVIYGKTGCSGCEQAKQLLEAKDIDYTYATLGKDYSISMFRLYSETHRSFPMIVLETDQYEQYIGTLDDLKKHLKENSL